MPSEIERPNKVPRLANHGDAVAGKSINLEDVFCATKNNFVLEDDTYRSLVLTCKSMQSILADVPIVMNITHPDLRVDTEVPESAMAPRVQEITVKELSVDCGGGGCWTTDQDLVSPIFKLAAPFLNRLNIETLKPIVSDQPRLQFPKLAILNIERCNCHTLNLAMLRPRDRHDVARSSELWGFFLNTDGAIGPRTDRKRVAIMMPPRLKFSDIFPKLHTLILHNIQLPDHKVSSGDVTLSLPDTLDILYLSNVKGPSDEQEEEIPWKLVLPNEMDHLSIGKCTKCRIPELPKVYCLALMQAGTIENKTFPDELGELQLHMEDFMQFPKLELPDQMDEIRFTGGSKWILDDVAQTAIGNRFTSQKWPDVDQFKLTNCLVHAVTVPDSVLFFSFCENWRTKRIQTKATTVKIFRDPLSQLQNLELGDAVRNVSICNAMKLENPLPSPGNFSSLVILHVKLVSWRDLALPPNIKFAKIIQATKLRYLGVNRNCKTLQLCLLPFLEEIDLNNAQLDLKMVQLPLLKTIRAGAFGDIPRDLVELVNGGQGINQYPVDGEGLWDQVDSKFTEELFTSIPQNDSDLYREFTQFQ